ncbi:hypothetical protein CesoFtcFv8_019195 [Champsocephalus esox]|uniref:Uncharacterized protein n=1 Tax=Champsocephalus esox TaxID=159716 RepID=A0AAN8BHV0_9TELE|nr:hypothetical protein CesoFtcFv8_019195 [Champsocephalus esox]
MAAKAVNKPPSAHPSRVHGNTRANGDVPSSDQHHPGLYTPCQDPGAPSHHLPGRPVFYVHAPPPPPFHPSQWPMPFSYNPFAGFPGMGYGMGMPPFPPPNPYMEVPAYIMPRPDMQPVDYRRFIHPQAQAPSVAYQNPYQPCRVRPHHTDPVRETVNSAVQTEPQQRGRSFSEESPLISADSGRGTAINSPSSSSSSSQKQNSAEVENDALHSSNEKDLPVKETSNKHGFNVLRPTGTTAIQSCIRETLDTRKSRKESVVQENVAPCKNAHCNMWSVGSQDGMVPVCSSSQQDCLPYADKLLQSSSSHKLPDNEQDYSIETNPFEDMAPITPSINNSSYLKRTWNESIWSVESLAPFIPTKVWLQRDDLLAADVIVEQAENDNPIVKSSPTKEDKNRSSEPEANQSPNQDILNEPQQKKRTSPPQQEESLNLNSIEKTCARKLNLQNGAGIQVEDGALGNEEVSLLGKEQLGVPMADQKTAEVSPSKVDFGVQCNEFQEHKCACEERRCSMGPNRNQPFTYSENKNGNYRQGEGPIMRGQPQKNQRKQGYRKPRGQGGSQHEAYSGYYGKPGKHQGGNGHNPPY